MLTASSVTVILQITNQLKRVIVTNAFKFLSRHMVKHKRSCHADIGQRKLNNKTHKYVAKIQKLIRASLVNIDTLCYCQNNKLH